MKGTVQAMLDRKDERHIQAEICRDFGKRLCLGDPGVMIDGVSLFVDLDTVRDRNIEDLSGGELQRFACAVVCIQRADV